MVKKVIDIFPPRQKAEVCAEADAKAEPVKIRMPLPAGLREAGSGGDESAAEPILRQDVKPRITFNRRAAGAENSGGIFVQEKTGGFFKKWLWRVGAVIAAILAMMYFWDAQFARAVIKIRPETSPLSRQMRVVVDSSAGHIDIDRGAIPGFSLAAEKTVAGNAPATGTKDAQGKAQGSVKIFNNYIKAQTLIKGTRLQAPLEKFQPAIEGSESPWFLITETVVIAPKSSTVAQVVASGPGEKYNIEPSVFSVPGLAGTPQYTFIYAQSFEKFTGGSLDAVSQVTKEDLENAKAAIENSAKEEIKKELISQAKEQGLEIVDESEIKIDIGSPEINAKAGDNVARIAGQILAKASVIAYKKSDLENLGKEFVLRETGEGFLCDENSFEFQSSYAGSETDGGFPALDLSVGATIYQGTNSEDLKKGLSEKKADEAKIFLMNQPGMRQVEIKLSPAWRFSVPRDLDRIEIQTILD
jgi:hypothetical protein